MTWDWVGRGGLGCGRKVGSDTHAYISTCAPPTPTHDRVKYAVNTETGEAVAIKVSEPAMDALGRPDVLERSVSIGWSINNPPINLSVYVQVLDKERIQQQQMGQQIKKEIQIMKMIRHRCVPITRPVVHPRLVVVIPPTERTPLPMYPYIRLHPPPFPHWLECQSIASTHTHSLHNTPFNPSHTNSFG